MKKNILFLILVFLIPPFSAPAQDKITVAVAASFMPAFKEMAADFEEQTGVKVEAAYSTADHLFRQIQEGVSYDVFLSEDERRPDLLQQEGWSEGSFIYARSQTVLWSANEHFCKAANWRNALQNKEIKKIGMANPLTAPDGAAAKTALQKAGLWEALQDKLFRQGDDTRPFPDAGAHRVDVGFYALSEVSVRPGKAGCHYEIPEAPAIVQAGCILKKTKNKLCAELFMVYMLSDQTIPFKKKYGYR